MSDPAQISSIKHMFDRIILMTITNTIINNSINSINYFNVASFGRTRQPLTFVTFKLYNTSPLGSPEISKSFIAWLQSQKGYVGCSQFTAALL